MEIKGKTIELDPEGYLVDPSDWDEEVAYALAKGEQIEITDEYRKVFSFMRDFYALNKVIPDVRHTTKQMMVDFSINKKEAKAKLFAMFPYGYVKQACKIAGMRRPRAWSTG